MQMGSAGLVTLPFTLTSFPLYARSEKIMIEDMVVINALGGISNQNLWARSVGHENENVGQASIRRIRSIDARAIKDTHASGTTAINVTLGYVAGPEEAYEYTIDDIAEWDALIRQYQNDLLKVWTVDDILKAKQENKIGIIFGFQNAESVGNKLERINTFSGLGVRIVQLTYNDRNQIGDGSAVAENQGLTLSDPHEIKQARARHSATTEC